jgi:hypothetical protein
LSTLLGFSSSYRDILKKLRSKTLQISENSAKISTVFKLQGCIGMRFIPGRDKGRADPLGLLVLAVVLALTVTIGIQAQATLGSGSNASLPPLACEMPCLTPETLRR